MINIRSRATRFNFVRYFTAQSTMKRLKLAKDASNKGFVCSSSNSITISDSEIWKLNESVYELHKPEGEPNMQVVFFHGFQYRNSADVHLATWESQDGSHYWPQTWLVKAFPGAHVFCVSYDARVEKRQGNFDLPIIGENLTWDLVQANIGQVPRCPVILVGHCFGGLVIKQLCSHAHKIVGSKGDSSETGVKFRRFLRNVKGIFYYATPHEGISPNIAPWFGHEGPLLPFVKTFSKYSARLKSEFDDLRHGHYRNAWRVAGVGESLPTKGGPFKDVVVVPEASARNGVESFNLVEGADHFSITTPESEIKRSFYALRDLIASVALDLKDNLPVHECQGLPNYPVDLERQALDIQRKLKDEQVLGIVGMGGIGKTTLAKQLFNNISREFEYTCFVDNAKGIKIHKLEDRLLGQFHHNGSKDYQPKTEWPHLRDKKTLIVIDDVNSGDQLSVLRKLDQFGSDSRVIITTRDRSVLEEFETYVIHDVEFLEESDAKTLFCNHAFKQGEIPSSLAGREQLVKDVEAVVRKCEGLPLTLEVIGRHLRGHENYENLWAETIVRLGTAQPIGGNREDRVWAKLKLSFDALGSEEQQMFINAATFFFNWPLERALAAWSTTCRTPVTGWRNLVEKSLVKEVCKRTYNEYSSDNVQQLKAIWVHEHLRDLGKFLAPGNTMSASNKEDLQKLSGLLNANPMDGQTEYLKLFDERWGPDSERMTFQFKSLLNLQQLKYVELKGMGLIGSPKKFPRKISMLCCDTTSWGCRNDYQHFPVSCIEDMENLAVLELRHWQTSQAFPEALGKLTNLRILELDSMQALNHLPEDFGCRLSNLKHLKLKRVSLSKLPESFGMLLSLEYIYFKELEMTELPESFGNLSSLVTAKFLDCRKLATLPTSFGRLRSLETLVLGSPGDQANMMLECLPNTFGQLKALRWLSMKVEKLQSLSSNFCCLSSLQELRIIGAKDLETLPEDLGQLTSLQELVLEVGTVKALPESVGRLSSLCMLSFHSDVAETLPDSLGQLNSLRALNISCLEIKNLPDSLWTLSSLRDLTITSCRELEFLSERGHLPSLQNLSICGSEKLKCLPDGLRRSSSLRELTIEHGDFEFLPEWLGDLPCLERLTISHCEKLKCLPDGLGRSFSLRKLWIQEEEWEFLPEWLGDLPSLQSLDIRYCEELKSLPDGLRRSSSLNELTIEGEECECLPEWLGDLPSLRTLRIAFCEKLKSLPDSLGRWSSPSNGLYLDIIGCPLLPATDPWRMNG